MARLVFEKGPADVQAERLKISALNFQKGMEEFCHLPVPDDVSLHDFKLAITNGVIVDLRGRYMEAILKGMPFLLFSHAYNLMQLNRKCDDYGIAQINARARHYVSTILHGRASDADCVIESDITDPSIPKAGTFVSRIHRVHQRNRRPRNRNASRGDSPTEEKFHKEYDPRKRSII